MSDNRRNTGFVIAVDGEGKEKKYKVRVRDQSSPLDGKKLSVASVQDGIELAKGLNVSFLIGNIDGEQGKFSTAVDVRLQ